MNFLRYFLEVTDTRGCRNNWLVNTATAVCDKKQHSCVRLLFLYCGKARCIRASQQAYGARYTTQIKLG